MNLKFVLSLFELFFVVCENCSPFIYFSLVSFDWFTLVFHLSNEIGNLLFLSFLDLLLFFLPLFKFYSLDFFFKHIFLFPCFCFFFFCFVCFHPPTHKLFQAPTLTPRKNLYFNVINVGGNKTLTVEGGGVNATVIQPDIAAINGIVHIIDRVLGVAHTTVGKKLAADPMLK